MEEDQTNFGKVCLLKDEKSNSAVQCEDKKINFIEQFVSEVLDFSSQYGKDTSISYTAYNLTGKPSKFPDYGDFPQVFVMKTYGNWWKEAPSKSLDYMPQNLPLIPSDDYIDVKFEQSVYPFRISIYETYNPGTVVRIWAKNDSSKTKMWWLLYEGEPCNVGHVPNIFSPVISTICFKTSTLRIEFNHSNLDYYTGIDAVLLVGTKHPISSECYYSNNLNFKNLSKLGKLTQQVYELNLHSIPDNHSNLEKIISHFHRKDEENFFKEKVAVPCRSLENLPDETILKILSYLDLLTLRSCSKLNRHFNALANDSLLYTSLSLNPYWDKIYDDTLIGFTKKCQHLQRLDMSWCGNYNMISSLIFERFIFQCCSALTHIRLNCCKFVTDSILRALAETCQNLEEIGLRNCVKLTDSGFSHLSGLKRLERLDLYRTNITSGSLIQILKANENMKHLNIGSCIKITDTDDIAAVISVHNKKFKSLDFWKTSNLTQIGVTALGHCSQLEEIDFGWCLNFALPVDSLASLANGCPNLRKLFLTALRGICDKDLEPFLRKCPNLEQIDLLGVRGITADICLRLLAELPRLKLLDLSFCDQISDSQVSSWRPLFPKVSIKRSFQTETSNNFLYRI